MVEVIRSRSKWELSTRATVDDSRKEQVRRHLEDYVLNLPRGDAAWLGYPEVPSETEIGLIKDGRMIEDVAPFYHVSANSVEGAFQGGIADYLATHAGLMRQDGVGPLREAVAEFRKTPFMNEEDAKESTRIYTNVSSPRIGQRSTEC